MKKKLLITGTLAIIVTIGFAQTTLKKAEKSYKAFNYDDAIKHYEFIKDRDINAQRSLAKSYAAVNNSVKAEESYSKLVMMPSYTSEDIYAYSQSLLNNQKYEEAQKQIDFFEIMAPNDKRAMEYRQAGNFIQKIKAINNDVKIKNLDINSPQQDFGASYYKDKVVYASSCKQKGLTMRKWLGNNLYYLDMFVADKEEGKIELIKNKKFTKNKKYHEGPATFNDAGDFMAFTRNDYKSKSQDGTVTLDLCTATLKDSKWIKASELHFESKEYSFGHPALTPDGATMYFASDMPGGKGGVDIYKINRIGEGWSEPQNLTVINTEGNEMFPFYHRDGILFFASNGYPGLGGLDVFVTKLTDLMPTGAVRNVGQPLNTNKDDFALIVDKEQKTGYLSSNREGGKGDDDIYSVEFTKPFKFGKIIKGIAKDKEETILANTNINLFDPQDKVVGTVITSDDGAYTFEVEELGNYTINGVKERYFDGKITANVNKKNELTIADVVLEKDPGLSLLTVVVDGETKNPLEEVKVTIVDENGKPFADFVTQATGYYKRPMTEYKVGDRLNYLVKLEKAGYSTKTVSFKYDITKSGEIKIYEAINLIIDKSQVGTNSANMIDIKPIYFDLGKFNIRKDAAKELDKIVKIMTKYPNMVVELGSHTDCRATAKFNEELSANRAKASAAYIKKSISKPERIYGKGYGESKLKNGCACEGTVKSTCTEDEHQTNRRTEFIIIKLD